MEAFVHQNGLDTIVINNFSIGIDAFLKFLVEKLIQTFWNKTTPKSSFVVLWSCVSDASALMS